MSDEMKPIPARFWGDLRPDNDPVVQTARHPDGGTLTMFASGLVTLEDWERGNFGLYDLQPDGTSILREGYFGVMVKRDDLMRLFPPRDEVKH